MRWEGYRSRRAGGPLAEDPLALLGVRVGRLRLPRMAAGPRHRVPAHLTRAGGSGPPVECAVHTGCGAAWLARRSGGPKVPSSNLGSPTNKSAGQGRSLGAGPLRSGFALCVLLHTRAAPGRLSDTSSWVRSIRCEDTSANSGRIAISFGSVPVAIRSRESDSNLRKSSMARGRTPSWLLLI